MNLIELPKESFSVLKLQELEKNGQLKDNQDALDYIFSYFYESSKQSYYFYCFETDDFEMYQKEEFSSAILCKLSEKKLKESIKKNAKIFSIVTELGNPRIYEKDKRFYINLAGSFLHKSYKKFDEYDVKTKERVNKILEMIKELACNGDEEMFKAYIKYYSQIARGLKTEVIIYRKSPEGVGKSTETTFMIDYVFGHKVCLLCNTADPLTSRFNKILLGKLLVIFEELPTFSDSEWNGVCGKLKSLCTEKRCTYEDKNEKRFEADNISNFCINTNMNAIKESGGRRIIVLDFSLKRKGDHKYFEHIKKECYNNIVGEAFFSYLMTVITDDESKQFYGQRDFPETKSKRLAISNTLCSIYKFLKEEYILTKKSIEKMKCVDLYEKYTNYCKLKIIRPIQRNECYKKFEEIGIFPFKTNGNNFYIVANEFLQKIADREKWICEYDEQQCDEDEEEEPFVKIISRLTEENTSKDTTITDLIKQIEDLKKQLLQPNQKTEMELLDIEIEKQLKTIEKKEKIIIIDKVKKVKAPLKKVKSSSRKVLKNEDLELNDDDITNLANLF